MHVGIVKLWQGSPQSLRNLAIKDLFTIPPRWANPATPKLGDRMVAYLKRKDLDEDETTPVRTKKPPQPKHALARDMLHGLSPEEFDVEAKSLAAAEALTPQVRERMRTQLVERLKTPIDPPSWGPDWIKRGEKSSPLTEKSEGRSRLASLFPFGR